MLISQQLFFLTLVIYFITLALYLVILANPRWQMDRTSLYLSIAGFSFHSLGLLIRWMEAGIVEVEAFEAAEGIILQGWPWFNTFMSHPPFTNLYESLVFFSWGIVLVNIYVEKKYQFKLGGFLGLSMAIAALGLASLIPGQQITPLVPALQSWWLHIHVIMASISYAGFCLAAVFAYFYLLRESGNQYGIGLFLCGGIFVILFLMGRGEDLWFNFQYKMTLMGYVDAQETRILASTGRGNGMSLFRHPVPGAGVLMILTVVAYLAVTIYKFTKLKALGIRKDISGYTTKMARTLTLTAFAFHTLFLLWLLYFITSTQGLSLDEKVVSQFMPRGISGPWHFSMHSNPYDLVLFLVLWGVMGFYLLVEFKLDVLIKRLPELQTLDLFSYRMILVAFPLLLLVIVTGAIWAHYSWGRYWGWDPKETWSLITWTIYALYLHTRITRGWVGRPSAIIAVVGFLMVIFTYLGVNLGLTGSGLHTYGSE